MTEASFPIKGVAYTPPSLAKRYYAENQWVPQTVGNMLRRRATAHPAKAFAATDHSTLSYAELDTRTDILAAALIELGLSPGDRAIFQMGTVVETLIALFACYKAGIVPVCTLPQHREIEIGRMINLTQARVYFVQVDAQPGFDLAAFSLAMAEAHGNVRYIIAARGRRPSGVHSLEEMAASLSVERAAATLASVEISPQDVLTFQLSGGSTGTPKIIPRFHADYLGQALGIVKRHQFTASDIAIWPLPLIHNAAMQLVVLPILLVGGTLVLQRRFDLHEFLTAIERNRVTFAGSIGPIAPSLLDSHDIARYDLSSLRMFFALDRADAIEACLGVPSTNLYGITEGLLMTCSPHDAATFRSRVTGYPTSDADEIHILRPDSEEPVSDGEEGELCFRGPHMLRGYYNAPDANRGSFTSNGMFRSEDLVRAELYEGRTYYTFVGRLKDNISRGGEKFSAEEVERLIVQHPAIIDVKIVAMPDRLLGEKACAFTIMRAEYKCPTVKELSAFLSAHGLAKYKHPEHIEVVHEFPLTKVGKVDKAAMRAVIMEKLSAAG